MHRKRTLAQDFGKTSRTTLEKTLGPRAIRILMHFHFDTGVSEWIYVSHHLDSADATIPRIPFATKWHKWVCRHLPWGTLFGNPGSTVTESSENYLGSASCSDRKPKPKHSKQL